MKKILKYSGCLNPVLCAFILLAGVSVADASWQSDRKAYIEKWSQVAVAEMYRSGVPASITLAQGMLESGNGKSELAVKGNNHFGIKCHDWKGPAVYFDDDKKHECFRKYAHAEASFRDHSDFLRYRDRYKFLFDLEPGDYKGWAYGLKKAGYATDPQYPQKLIRIIEEFNLSRFDNVKSVPVTPAQLETPVKVATEDGRKSASGTIPDESFSFRMSRSLYSQNKVPFIYLGANETLADVAKSYDLFVRELLRFNDIDSPDVLREGSVVYIQAKKKKAAKKVDKYVADGGESLWEVSQRFAVRLSSLAKLNGLSADHILKPEETIRLR